MQKKKKKALVTTACWKASLLKNYRTLYTSIEEPLYEDDSKASLTKGGLIRLYSFDV
jgi:hypothetical protein